MVSSSLDPTQRNEWRSSVFDPPSPEGDAADDVVCPTRPRIFTLFPRVTALKLSAPLQAPTGLPGSWPEDVQEPRTIETYIHPGMGLPEFSVLVLKGKEEEELRKERIEEELLRDQMAALEKELKARGGRSEHSRNGSIAGLASGPTSPTAQWMGRRKLIDED